MLPLNKVKTNKFDCLFRCITSSPLPDRMMKSLCKFLCSWKMQCENCKSANAVVKRPKNGLPVCKSCFLVSFEKEVHETVVEFKLFTKGETVAVGVSGGKDSSVILHVLNLLNDRYDYGLNLVMVAIDEGIVGYRDHSLDAVQEQQKKYGLPLKILSYDELFGWTMDRVVETTGRRGNCTYCGVFRRQALEKGAVFMSAHKLATGHNADDVAETVLMNLLRGDTARLQRCAHPLSGSGDELPRCKPLYRSYEKEIVLYARFQNLQYFATECLYAPNAYRGHARTLIKQLERLRPRAILDILVSGESLANMCKNLNKNSIRSTCTRCGSVSSRPVCYACSLMDQLNGFNLPKLINLTRSVEDKEEIVIEDLSKNMSKINKKSCACNS